MKKILLIILLTSSFFTNAQFWTEKATGFTTPGRGLYSISIVDAGTVWAVASNYDGETEDTTIKEFTKSTNGGNTWTPGTIDLGPDTNELGISSITATSPTTAWVSATNGATQLGGIWKTLDGGVTWTKQTTAQFSDLDHSYANFVHFWDADYGIAMGDPDTNLGKFEIYTTSDGGTTWTRVPAANIPDPVAGGEFGYENLYAVSGNTIWFGTDMGRIFKSNDKGLTWAAYQTPSADFMFDNFAFSDVNKGLITIYDLPILIYKTIDGGETWNQVATTGAFNTDIAYIPGTSTVVASDWKNPKGSSYSQDDGANWIAVDSGISHGTLKFLNSSFGFSGGFNTNATTGGIYKFTGIPPLKTQKFDVEKQISAYPNPTNGILQLDSKFSFIKETKVFDLIGRQVFDSKFQPLNKVTLDLNSLQTGLYLLQVESDSGKTETMKIMKN